MIVLLQNPIVVEVAKQPPITPEITYPQVIVGAIGPGAERFKGYMDNTDFGRILQSILERP